MIFKILITIIALAPNALIGYVYFNRNALIEQQKDALIKTLSSKLTEQLSKQTKDLTGNMDSLFTDKIKPEMDTQHQGQLDALPKETGPAIPFTAP
jgi:hypothetical protein